MHLMYKVYHTNLLENFIDTHWELFYTKDFFTRPVYVIIQNQNMAHWLKLKLAEKRGITANIKFGFADKMLREFLEGYEKTDSYFKDKTLLFMDDLKLVVFKNLELIFQDPHTYPEFKPLIDYIGGGEGDNNNYSQADILEVRGSRLYSLADSIAGLFYHYGMNCRPMVQAWEEGVSYKEDHPQKDHEVWQKALWNRIFSEDSSFLYLGRILHHLVDSKDSYTSSIVPRIIVFGSSFLSESSFQFYYHLSQDLDIHHFLLSPSTIYSNPAGDMEKVSLLKSWGGLIEGFSILEKREELPSNSEFIDPLSVSRVIQGSEDTLLGKIQHSILYNKSDMGAHNIIGDNSFKVFSTTGKWREVEILKDGILKILDENKQLQMTDICILAPDINEYTSYIDAIFASKDRFDLPYNVMDLNFDSESSIIQGFFQLLDLAAARFTRKDLFSLFSNPCFAQKFNITRNDLQEWLDFCDHLHMKWGIDGSHRKQLGLGASDFNTFEEGFSRFILGLITEGKEETRRIRFPDGQMIPFSSVSGENELFEKVIYITRALYADLTALQEARLSLGEWTKLAEKILITYLEPAEGNKADEYDLKRLKNSFGNLIHLLKDLDDLEGFEDKGFDFPVFRRLLLEHAKQSGVHKGAYLTGGLTFSSLKPLRAIPFKVIVILGLNENSFPMKESLLSFDLRGLVENAIDLSRRNTDRFTFLEALLSAREQLHLYYTGVDNVSGETLQPSVTLNELFDYINGTFQLIDGDGNPGSAEKLLVTRHPLQPFNPEYFKKGNKAGLFSYNPRTLEEARVYYNREKQAVSGETARSSLTITNYDEEITGISVQDLVRFLRNPVRTFYNQSLGIYFEIAELQEENINENIEIGYFQKTDFYRRLIETWQYSQEEAEELAQDFINTEGLKGAVTDTKLAFFDVEGALDDVKRFSQTFEDNFSALMIDGKVMLPPPVTFVLSDIEGVAHPSRRFISSLPVKLSGGRSVELTGDLRHLRQFEEDRYFSIQLCGTGAPSPAHYFEQFLYALILGAHPAVNTGLTQFDAYLVGKKSYKPKHFIYEEIGSAASLLSNLVELYLENLKNPLPLYEVCGTKMAKFVKKNKTAPDVEIAQMGFQAYEKDISDDFGGISPNRPGNCPYGRRGFPSGQGVDFTRPGVIEFVKAFYGALV